MTKNLAVPSSEEEAEANRASLTSSKTAWKKSGVHKGVVCPSGAVISVRLPNLAELAEADAIPNELVDIATAAGQVEPDQVPDDALKKLAQLQRFIVSVAVVEPSITPEDVRELPTEDIAFIEQIAYRQRDVDALGNQIAGLDKLAKYATFREIDDSDEVALDA